MVTWYWSADSLIWQVSIDHNMMPYIKKVHRKPRLHVNLFLVYGSCARNTSGSQNLGVLPKNDTIAFLFAINKTMSKLLWPLLVVNLRIPGLIWRGKAYFVQNNTTIGSPDDTRRTTSEVPCRTPSVHFWRQINSLEARNFSYFSFFYNLIRFVKLLLLSPFLCIFNAISSKKRGLISVPFLTC